MKDITEAIKRLTPELLKSLAAQLKIKKSAAKDIIPRITSIVGLVSILKELDTDELRVLQTVYSRKGGFTFGEIEKELKLEIRVIEKIANTLHQNLLVYIIKNRQMLNTKLDKAYGIKEIASVLNIAERKTISDRIHRIVSALEGKRNLDDANGISKDGTLNEFLNFIASNGCVVTIEEAVKYLNTKKPEKIIGRLLNENKINIYHVLQHPFTTYLILSEKIAAAIASRDVTGGLGKPKKVTNHFFLLNNLLNAFDTVSTFGLFLTKQLEFRKIDLKRISESMLELQDIQDNAVPPEMLASLSILILNRLGCLKMNKDIASISFTEIKKDLENPLAFLKSVIKNIDSTNPDERFFIPPFDLPTYEYIKNILRLLHRLNRTSFRYLNIIILARALETAGGNYADRLQVKAVEEKRLENSLNFLCIAGIIEIKNGLIGLSDIGKRLSNITLKLNISFQPSPPQKSLYINADFSLLIPVNELDSVAIYHLITHTDILKKDVIINALISKDAIIRAHKRGMTINKFIDTLKSLSKNELPQNLNYLLTEWSNQTISISITQHILLKSSHSSFIDELLYGKLKEGIIERISGNHALVKKEFIDEIVKVARKKDAVISLFSDTDGDI